MVKKAVSGSVRPIGRSRGQLEGLGAQMDSTPPKPHQRLSQTTLTRLERQMVRLTIVRQLALITTICSGRKGWPDSIMAAFSHFPL